MGARQNMWKKRNRDAMTAYRKQWMKDHPEKRREYESRYKSANRDKVNERIRGWKRRTGYDRVRGRRIREEVIKKYGGKCVCCGTAVFEFLSFDHKNGRGKSHREVVLETGQKFVMWLYKHEIQEDIQILCHNCNQSFGHYGFCPHHPEIFRPILHGRKRR
jgi:hypothetical protein